MKGDLKKLPQQQFVNYIKQGMKEAWHHIFLMTGRLHEEVKPEYITTAAICFSLAEKAGFFNNGFGLSVNPPHSRGC